MMLSKTDIERWQSYWSEAIADPHWEEWMNHLHQVRPPVQVQLRQLFEDFRTGTINIQNFQKTFHKKMRTEWIHFGLKGMSGAMFLNKLVKHLHDKEKLSRQLKTALDCPSSETEAEAKINQFPAYLEAQYRLEYLPIKCCNRLD